MQLKQNQKVKCVGGAQVRYKYGLENLTTSKEYVLITGFGQKCKDPSMSNHLHTCVCGEYEFEIIDDNGEACWATLASIEEETIFEVV